MPHFFGRREGTEGVVIEGSDAVHLARSLRARPGEAIRVVDPAGFLLEVRLDSVSPDRVEGTVVAEREHRPEPSRQVTVAIAALPAGALEHVLSRCTEAGASGFVLLSADRSVARGAKPERWHAICREAAMLAGRTRVPAVAGPDRLEAAWAAARNPIMAAHDGRPALEMLAGADPVTLFVGPEGGWTPAERRLAGGRALSLGPRNLRAETAALVAVALALGGS